VNTCLRFFIAHEDGESNSTAYTSYFDLTHTHITATTAAQLLILLHILEQMRAHHHRRRRDAKSSPSSSSLSSSSHASLSISLRSGRESLKIFSGGGVRRGERRMWREDKKISESETRKMASFLRRSTFAARSPQTCTRILLYSACVLEAHFHLIHLSRCDLDVGS